MWQDGRLAALCRDWLLNEGQGTPEWDHLYEECLDKGVNDQEFLGAGLEWVRRNLEEIHSLFILGKLLGAIPHVTPETPAVLMTLDWLRSHLEHPSWTFLWRDLYERGLRGEVEALGVQFCERRPAEKSTTYVVRALGQHMNSQSARRIAALAAANPCAPPASAGAIGAYTRGAGDSGVVDACRQWLLAFPRRKPKGWGYLFCLLPPDQHSAETLALGVGMIVHFPIQDNPGMLLYLARLHDRLAPPQRNAVRRSALRSLAGQPRPLSKEWQQLADLAAEWGSGATEPCATPGAGTPLPVTNGGGARDAAVTGTPHHLLVARNRENDGRPPEATPVRLACSDDAVEALINVLRRVPVRDTPGTLAAVAALRSRLNSEQAEVFAHSLRQSLANPARKPGPEWDDLSSTLAELDHMPSGNPPGRGQGS